MINEGMQAPDFVLKGVDGKEHRLDEFRGRRVVLYFYPKDDTPGCTLEAIDFTNHKDEIAKLNAVVVGISMDDYESHCKFRDRHALDVLILSDTEGGVVKQYGAYGNKGIFGKGILRTTFVIDANGKVIKIWKKVQALGHITEVLDYLKTNG